MSAEPPVPLPAATMLLLRQRRSLEVFMVVRHGQLDFAGALVFPGGKVDPADSEPGLRALCGETGGVADAELAFRVAAVREAFEEAGILLARDASGELISGARLAELAPYRLRLERDEIGVGDFLRAENLSLACDMLHPFAHWITPESQRKRFDTHFFVGIAPDDHDAAHDGRESVSSIWGNPSQLLEQAEQGQWTVLLPTKECLKRLSLSATAHEAFAQASIEPVVTVGPVRV